MPLNEADTRAQLIDTKLNVAGWTRSRVTREQYYRTDWAYTAGRVVLRGDHAVRLPPRRVDYVLRYTDSFPIAVVEAKDEGKPAIAGLEQAKRYARDLGLMFAYATNGREIIEWDAFTNTTRTLEQFPSPARLWKRWQRNTGLDTPPPHPDVPNAMIDEIGEKLFRRMRDYLRFYHLDIEGANPAAHLDELLYILDQEDGAREPYAITMTWWLAALINNELAKSKPFAEEIEEWRKQQNERAGKMRDHGAALRLLIRPVEAPTE